MRVGESTIPEETEPQKNKERRNPEKVPKCNDASTIDILHLYL